MIVPLLYCSGTFRNVRAPDGHESGAGLYTFFAKRLIEFALWALPPTTESRLSELLIAVAGYWEAVDQDLSILI